jgi:ADP-ribose pyrophosphatase
MKQTGAKMKVEVLQSEIRYRGRAFNVRQDEIRLPDGRSAQLDVVDHSAAITIVPVDEVGDIWFVRQYRHPTQKLLLELPAGTLEPNEQPEAAALREIREEIGMAAAEMRLLGEFFLAPGYSTEYMYVYLATGLSPAPLAQDDDEFIFVEKYPAQVAYQRLNSSEYQDAKTLLGLYLARPLIFPA